MATFLDAKSEEWELRLTTPLLLRISRKCDLSLAKLMSGQIRIDEVLEMVWLACEEQARARACSREDFLEARLAPAALPSAVQAVFAALKEAFPQMEDAAEAIGPLADAAKAALGKYAI